MASLEQPKFNKFTEHVTSRGKNYRRGGIEEGAIKVKKNEVGIGSFKACIRKLKYINLKTEPSIFY